MFIMNFLSRSEEKGGDVIFQFQEKYFLKYCVIMNILSVYEI